MKLKTLKCKKCGHEWLPRVASPRKCPCCNQPWNKGRIYKKRFTVNSCNCLEVFNKVKNSIKVEGQQADKKTLSRFLGKRENR